MFVVTFYFLGNSVFVLFLALLFNFFSFISSIGINSQPAQCILCQLVMC